MRNFPKFLGEITRIKRAAELGHFSEGWPPLCESRTRMVRGACCRIAILLTLVAIAFPVYGVNALFGHNRSLLPMRLYAEVLVPQLLAPVFLLLLEGLIGYCTFSQKRIPLWVVLIGLVGAFGMSKNGGKGTHDISHELFESCYGYREFVSWLAASIALLFTLIWLSEFRILRGWDWRIIKISKRMRRALGLLLFLACWFGLLSFFEWI